MKRGFTLVELIVVIAIIAILAAVVAPNAFKAIEKAKISGTLADLNTIKTASMSYYGDTGSWPWICGGTPNNCSVGFVSNPTAATVTGWDGPYLEKWPANAKWGGGTYTYYNGTAPAINWSLATATVAGAIPARFVIVGSVPRDARQKMDEASDGSNTSTTGSVRHDFTTAGVAALNYLVSYDGTLL